ncbi:MAG: dihydropteroate synthase [Chitinophagales bacterium]|nr:dihydropteroate synthase [Chitinophagales bacterium]
MNFSINCRGRLLDLSRPVVMGILNVTPDSFYDGGKYTEPKAIVARAETLLSEGAAIIDVGGMSSRPGSSIVSPRLELERVLPAIDIILEKFPDTILSIDTLHSEVAMKAVERGVSIVNDISGGKYDREMIHVVAAMHVPYVVMHMKGTPDNMMQQAVYEDVTAEVFDFLQDRIYVCTEAGIHDIIIDVGFGFSKNLEQNYTLLRQLEVFAVLGKPMLAGLSRKRMAWQLLNLTPEEALPATLALETLALSKGVHILRAHDVQEAIQCIKVWEAYNFTGGMAATTHHKV